MRLHRDRGDEGNVVVKGGKENERKREREKAGRRGKCVSEEKKIDRRREEEIEGKEAGGGGRAEMRNETAGRDAREGEKD